MKLGDLIAKVHKATNLFECDCAFTDIVKEFELDYYHLYDTSVWDARVREYWLAPWYCTDSWVGLSVIYFDDEPVATVFQAGRKCDREYEWVSAELREKLRNFTVSMIAITPEKDIFTLVDLDQEFPDAGYQIGFGEQCLTSEVIYDGKLLKVDKTWNRYPNIVQYNDPDWGKIALISGDGSRIIVDTDTILVPYRIDK